MVFHAYYDGKVFIPYEAIDLAPGTQVEVTILVISELPNSSLEIDQYLERNPELKPMWRDLARGRDHAVVAQELREKAASRGKPNV